MVLENFLIDVDVLWDRAGKELYEKPEARAGRKMRVRVTNKGLVEDLTGYTLNLGWKSRIDETKFGLDAFTAVDITKGIFEIAYTSGMLTNIGTLVGTLQLVPSVGNATESNNFMITVKKSAVDAAAVQSETSFTALTSALVSVNDWNTRIDAVEADFIQRANDVEATYAPRLLSAEQRLAEAELNKVDKNGSGQVGWANIAQDAREQIIGTTPPAVVGVDSVLEVNITDGAVTPKTTSFFDKILGKNLFDKTAVTNGGYYNYSNNQFWANVAWNYSDPIDVVGGQTYNAHDNSDTMINFKDSAGAFISGVTLAAVDATFTTPPNAATIVVSLKTTKLNTFQIELGSTFTGYVAYSPPTYELPKELQENGIALERMMTSFESDAVVSETNKATDLTNPVWGHSRTYLTGNTLYMSSGYVSCDPYIALDTPLRSMAIGDKISFRFKVRRLSDKITAWRFNIRVGAEIGNLQGLTKESEEAFREIGEWCIVEGSYTFTVPATSYKLGIVFVTPLLTADEALMEFDFSDTDSYIAYGDVPFGTWGEVADSYRGRNKAVSAILPPEIYTVTNDLDLTVTARRYALPIYSNYLINQKHDVGFGNGKRKFIFGDLYTNGFSSYTAVGGKVIKDVTVSLQSDSGEFDITQNKATVKSVNTLMSANVQQAFVLPIGDSVTEWGDNADKLAYYNIASEMFEKEAFDKSINNPVTFIGAKQVRERTLDYKGTPITVKACAEGRGGHSLHNLLRWTSNVRSQATWDACGLGDGSHTDYVASEAQNTLMRKTCMTDTSLTPANYFFDNDLNGGLGRAFTDTEIAETRYSKFSINKFLSRYRTMDDSGNRLTLGNGTGSLITADNINLIDVCTPTHICIAMGHNDMENITTKGDVNEYHSNIKEIVASIRSELPTVKIIFAVSQPLIGLWDKTEYPNYINIPDPTYMTPYLENVEWMVNNKSAFEADNIYELPNYWVTPSAEAFTCATVSDGTTTYYQPFGASQEPHPNAKTHWNYGYQLYAMLKYLLV